MKSPYSSRLLHDNPGVVLRPAARIEFVPVINGFVPQNARLLTAAPDAFNPQQRACAGLAVALHEASPRSRGNCARARFFVPLTDELVTSRDESFTYFIRNFGRRLSSPQCCDELRQGWIKET